MSYSRSKPTSLGENFTNRDELVPSFYGLSPSMPAIDSAIDAALRRVPLPDGLLTRLGRLAYSMPDEAADRFDYLGC